MRVLNSHEQRCRGVCVQWLPVSTVLGSIPADSKMRTSSKFVQCQHTQKKGTKNKLKNSNLNCNALQGFNPKTGLNKHSLAAFRLVLQACMLT